MTRSPFPAVAARAAMALALLPFIGGCAADSPSSSASPSPASRPAASAAPSAAPSKENLPPLRVSAIPDVQPSQLAKQYEPMAAYLAKALGREVTFTPVTDYPATVEGIAAGRLDLVWFGGYTSVQAMVQSKGNVERLVLREEDAHFKSVFIAAPDSGIKTLADLKGKTFSFGSDSSTSGHLMPRHFLVTNGIDPEKDLAKISFSGAHDATVKAVESGQVQAGALNFLVWERLTKEGKVDATKVAVFFTTPEYVDYCWVASKNLPEADRAALRKAFLDLDPAKPEDAELLKLQNASRFIPAKDEDWKGIEAAARAAGMLKD